MSTPNQIPLDVKFTESVLKVGNPSGAEENMRLFIIDYLTKLNIKYYQDESGNLYNLDFPNRPLLSAHMDSKQDGIEAYLSEYIHEENGVFSGYGLLGGDDKCGIAMILQILKLYPNINFTFFVNEEVGCRGSSAFMAKHDLPDVLWGIVLDRKGSSDIICEKNSYGTIEFENALAEIGKRFNFTPERGLVSDADQLSTQISCANLSSGYFYPHTDKEIATVADMENTMNFVIACINEITMKFPAPKKYVYTAPSTKGWGGSWYSKTGEYASKGSFKSYGYGGFGEEEYEIDIPTVKPSTAQPEIKTFEPEIKTKAKEGLVNLVPTSPKLEFKLPKDYQTKFNFDEFLVQNLQLIAINSNFVYHIIDIESKNLDLDVSKSNWNILGLKIETEYNHMISTAKDPLDIEILMQFMDREEAESIDFIRSVYWENNDLKTEFIMNNLLSYFEDKADREMIIDNNVITDSALYKRIFEVVEHLSILYQKLLDAESFLDKLKNLLPRLFPIEAKPKGKIIQPIETKKEITTVEGKSAIKFTPKMTFEQYYLANFDYYMINSDYVRDFQTRFLDMQDYIRELEGLVSTSNDPIEVGKLKGEIFIYQEEGKKFKDEILEYIKLDYDKLLEAKGGKIKETKRLQQEKTSRLIKAPKESKIRQLIEKIAWRTRKTWETEFQIKDEPYPFAIMVGLDTQMIDDLVRKLKEAKLKAQKINVLIYAVDTNDVRWSGLTDPLDIEDEIDRLEKAYIPREIAVVLDDDNNRAFLVDIAYDAYTPFNEEFNRVKIIDLSIMNQIYYLQEDDMTAITNLDFYPKRLPAAPSMIQQNI